MFSANPSSIHSSRTARSAARALLLSLLLTGAAGLDAARLDRAWAGDCNSDVAGLSGKRQTFVDKLNVLAKSSKGKLDPVASCPVLRGLVKAEGELLKYLEANKNWCNVPDDAVNNLKAADAKSAAFATQACNFAEQAKKQQQQAASSASLGVQAQKLPAGPL